MIYVREKKKIWDFIDREVDNALNVGAGVIIQMDSNSHLGREIIEEDVNDQNANGKLFSD